ncbi:M23 family metallopeptidase, partial [Candidatus Latescibacterota bacterium]
ITVFVPSVTAAAEEIIWPIDYYQHISSSFGEPRPGRFHYGVDFKSGGVTGKKVFATGDGYILQARTTPFGYGKSLYLKLDSGEIIVYGHLSKYLPEIEDIFFNLRIREKTYDVQWWPKAQEFRVKKGQVIAYSGDSGGSTPHLHLEIRDENNDPLNPLAQGVNIRDTISPRINSALLIPLDKHALVDGYPVPKWIDFSNSNTAPVNLSGRIGVAASIWDTVNNSNNLLGVYRASLAVDSNIVFSKQYDTLSYLYNGQGALDYLPGEYFGGKGTVSALFRREGNFLNIYDGNGILIDNNPESTDIKTISIKASDYAKNETIRTFSVKFANKPIFEYCGYTSEGNFRIAGIINSGVIDRAELWENGGNNGWKLADTYFIMKNKCDINFKIPQSQSKLKVILTAEDSTESVPVILRYNHDKASAEKTAELNVTTELLHDRIIARINSNRILSSIPIIREEKNGATSERIICSVPTGETSWIASIPLPETGRYDNLISVSAFDISGNKIHAETEIDVTVLNASSQTIAYSADSLMTLEVPPGALYRSASMIISNERVNKLNGLKQVSGGYRINLGDIPLKNAIRVKLALESEPPEKAALFQSNGNGDSNNANNWRFISSEREENVFFGDIAGPGCVAVLSDTIPPYVLSKSPRSGGTIKTRKPQLLAYVEDKESGIEGSDSFKMSIDSIPIYAEYDFARHTISYTLHNDLSPGMHSVTLSVTDRVGNIKTIEWSFRIAQ